VILEVISTLNKVLQLIMSSLRDSEFPRSTQRLLATERRAEEERRARQQVEQRNQKTLLDELLTNPENRYYLKNLKKWENFAEEQYRVFSTAHNIFHPKIKPALRLFSPILSVEDQGRLHCNIRIANEASLRNYEKSAIEVQVAEIINRLSEIMQDPKQFQLGQGISFENDPNSLNEIAEEVQERLHIQPPRTPSPTAPPSSSSSASSASNLEPDSNPKPGRTRADQYCITEK